MIPVDWEERDKELAEAVRLSAIRIKALPSYPIRVTKTEIADELGKPDLAKWKLSQLPLTSIAFSEVTESLEDFAIRRIQWVSTCYLQEGVCLAQSQLQQQAGLSGKTAALPRVKRTIAEAMERLYLLNSNASAPLPNCAD